MKERTDYEMKILVTGFDPFGGEPVNPAIETVKRLPDVIAGAEIVKLEIPTVCHQSLRVIDEAIAGYDPDVVLSVGQAGGRPDITVERVGINVDDSGRLCGDVDLDAIQEKASMATPVPGGVGAVTTAVLARHLALAAARQERT